MKVIKRWFHLQVYLKLIHNQKISYYKEYILFIDYIYRNCRKKDKNNKLFVIIYS